MAKKIDIGGELHSVATDHKVADASEIKDISKGNKSQTAFNNDVDRHEVEIHGTGGIDSRLTDVEQIEQIVLDGGEAQIAQGSDFTNPDATKRAKIPTVGAIVDGLNDGIYDVSKRNPTGGPNSDGKFTLDYILDNANTLIPTGWRHGGMTISFVSSSDNKYVQYRLMIPTFSTIEGNWQQVVDSQLEVKMQGITAREEKVGLITSGEGQNVFSDKYLKNDGKITVSASHNDLLIVNVGEAKKVRFLGVQITGTTLSYGFASTEPDSTNTTDVQVAVADLKTYDSGQSRSKEYVVDVPAGKPWFVCSIAKTLGSESIMTLEDFYCYLQTGYSAASTLESGPFDVSLYNKTSYASLSDALAAIPSDYRRGGMSVKFKDSDNKYVQYRLISDAFNTTPANWQGVDDELTPGSNNLAKSGNVYSSIANFKPAFSLTYGGTYTWADIATNFENGTTYYIYYGNRRYDLVEVPSDTNNVFLFISQFKKGYYRLAYNQVTQAWIAPVEVINEVQANKVNEIDDEEPSEVAYPSVFAVWYYIRNVITAIREWVESIFAKTTGDYPKMSVGSSKRLENEQPITGSFFMRTTANDGDVENGDEEIANGLAKILEVEGNSVKYNQLVPDNKISGTLQTTTQYGNINFPVAIISGHKYYIKSKLTGVTSNIRIGLGDPTRFTTEGVDIGTTVDTTLRKIGVYNKNGVEDKFIIMCIENASVNVEVSDTQCIDLTALGINNLTTVEEVEAWLKENWGESQYYAYSAGKVVNVNMTGIESTNRNLLDANGNAELIGNYDIGGTYGSYYGICGTYDSVSFVDKKGNTVALDIDEEGKFEVTVDGILTVLNPSADCAVFLWWDGSKTDYVEHKVSTGKLDVSHIYGKKNGQGELVRVWPTGMPAIGNLKDILTTEDGVPVAKRVLGEVNMGLQEITTTDHYGGTKDWLISAPNIKPATSTDEVSNIICALYQTRDIGSVHYTETNAISAFTQAGKLMLHDTSYNQESDLSSITTKLTGVMAYYELETPETYTDLVYQNSDYFEDGTPVIMPTTYEADNWGIEVILPKNTSDVVTAMPTVTNQYSIDTIETIKTLNDVTEHLEKEKVSKSDLPTITVGMAETLAPWADQKAIATPDTYTDAVRTTGGDIPIETSAGSKLESIKPVAGSKWTVKMLFNGSYNMLNAAKWGAANSQPYVGGVGSDFVYFLVPELTLGTFGTTDENNGLLFTNAQGENVEPTSVYFKPLGSTVPQSLTDGTPITPTTVNYDGKTYKDYATDGAGWLIIPKTYYDNDICAHIAWEDWYDKHVSLDAPNTNPEAVIGALILEGMLDLVHSNQSDPAYKHLLGINDEVCDYLLFGDTSVKGYHMVDELSVAANAWTNSATGESDSQGNALYRHSATVSGIKQGGAACIKGNDGGIPLTVNGTTVSYVDTNATVTDAQTVFYQIPTTEEITRAYWHSVFNGSNINKETGVLPINDCSIEAQVAMDGTANITVKYAKNIVDQVAINAATDVPKLQEQVEEHEERITELEDTAVRTNSYDASVAVGLADNLKGDTVVEEPFFKRKTGGTKSVGSGIAAIKDVKGKSIVWNQLCKINANPSATTETWKQYDYVSTISRNTETNEIYVKPQNLSSAKGCDANYYLDGYDSHKFYIKIGISCDQSKISSVRYGANGTNSPITIDITSGKALVTDVITKSNIRIIRIVSTFSNSATSSDVVTIEKPIIIDLTLMFGAGNEPANVAEFEKIFPLNYYDYNAGEVIPFAGQNLVTIGFNLWDEQWESGNISSNDGSNSVDPSKMRSKNYIRVSPNTEYYCVAPNNCYVNTRFYDADKQYIGTGGFVSGVQNHTFTVPEGAYYLRIQISEYGTTYNNDICINISDSDKNGTYKPYEKHTLPLDPSQWRDKQGNLVFPYGGMHGVGTAYDYAKVDADGYIRKAVKVYERRAYESGDVASGNIITDGSTYTFYPLAEPVEVELATPVYAKYLVDKDGTEEITPANGSTPYTTMANLSILYAMDARGEVKNLPKNYLSKESAENMLNAMVTAGIIARYTMTYDAANGRYQFTIVAPAQSNE